MQGLVICWAAGATGLAIGCFISLLDVKRALRQERSRSDRLYNIAFGYEDAA